MKLFLAPHNDDETLFGAYTILREKPLVVICTDSYIEWERGDGVTKEERIDETKAAMNILQAAVQFLHIPDSSITSDILMRHLETFQPEVVYAPAIEEEGNPIHNLVGETAKRLFPTVHYMTYNRENTKTQGSRLIIPTSEEKELKRQALACYPSQLKIPTCKPFFDNNAILEWESYL